MISNSKSDFRFLHDSVPAFKSLVFDTMKVRAMLAERLIAKAMLSLRDIVKQYSCMSNVSVKLRIDHATICLFTIMSESTSLNWRSKCIPQPLILSQMFKAIALLAITTL